MIIDIALCVDAANLMPATVVIRSVVASARSGARHRFHVIFDGRPGRQLRIFRRLVRSHDVSVHFSPVSFDRHLPKDHVARVALFRTQLSSILVGIERVIYLDADLIVRKDLAALFATDLKGAAMAGVVDIPVYARIAYDLAHGNHLVQDHLANVVGLDLARTDYINCGVLLMDLRLLREMEFSRRAVETFDLMGDSFIWQDQDLINRLLNGKMKLVDPRWNVLASFMTNAGAIAKIPPPLVAEFAAQRDEQWIIHYSDRFKPWNSNEVWKREVWWDAAGSLVEEWERRNATPSALQVLAAVYRALIPLPVRRLLLPFKAALKRISNTLSSR